MAWWMAWWIMGMDCPEGENTWPGKVAEKLFAGHIYPSDLLKGQMSLLGTGGLWLGQGLGIMVKGGVHAESMTLSTTLSCTLSTTLSSNLSRTLSRTLIRTLSRTLSRTLGSP